MFNLSPLNQAIYDITLFFGIWISLDFLNEYATQEIENQIKSSQEFEMDLTASAGEF